MSDAIRKILQLSSDDADIHQIEGWRQSQFNVRQVKKAYRLAQKTKRSTSKDPLKKQKQQQIIIQAHSDYIELCQKFIDRSQQTLATEINHFSLSGLVISLQIEGFIAHATRQIDQIDRRVIQGETIPHEEKVFSIFEPHTEWISKGKAGVPVELGLKVCIVENEQGYILHHRVMQKETDDQIAIDIMAETQARYPDFRACSFDKGFHSPSNQIELAHILDQVILPKKGRCNKKEQERESSNEFRKSRKKDSAVESGINALEVHGLDQCPDHGINGFKRYVALAIVARNIQKLGSELIKKDREKEKRSRKTEKLAA